MQPEHGIEHGMFVRRRTVEGGSGTIVYIHGLGESGLCFEGLAADRRLAGWSHLIPDLPGYGRSGWAAEPLSLAEQARHLARWLVAGAPRRFVLLGHSMGGVLGVMLCELPELAGRIKAFVNVEGNVTLDDCQFSGRAEALELGAFVAEGRAALLEEVYRGGVDDEALRSYYVALRLCDPRAYHLNSCELVALSSGGDLPRRYAGVGVPQIYLYGDPRGTGAASLAALERAGVTCRGIGGAGHWPFIDRRATFIHGLATFFAGIGRSGG
jgi:pimeloyl-ACP methyl ester carboxylesterase